MTTAADIMKREYVNIDVSEPLSSLIGKFIKLNESDACVFDKKRFIGLFSHDLLLKSRIDIRGMKLKSVTAPVPHLKNTDDIVKIASLMFDANTTILPVVEKRFIGIVSIFDVLSHIGEISGLEKTKVAEIRHPAPITIGEDEKINKAMELMSENHIDRLPVVDGRGNTSGFLSHIDIMDRFYVHHARRDEGSTAPKAQTRVYTAVRDDILALPVKDFMSKGELIITDEKDSIAAAAKKMIVNRVLSLLILKNGSPSGILTKRDILEAMMSSKFRPMRNIQFARLESIDIDEFAKRWVMKISSFYAEKLAYLVKNELNIALHFKEYKKKGKQHKFSIHARAIFPGGTVASGNAHDWDIRRAVHKAFRDLEHQLRSRFKKSKAAASVRKSSEGGMNGFI